VHISAFWTSFLHLSVWHQIVEFLAPAQPFATKTSKPLDQALEQLKMQQPSPTAMFNSSLQQLACISCLQDGRAALTPIPKLQVKKMKFHSSKNLVCSIILQKNMFGMDSLR